MLGQGAKFDVGRVLLHNPVVFARLAQVKPEPRLSSVESPPKKLRNDKSLPLRACPFFRHDSCYDVDLSETGSGQSASFLNLDTPDNWLAFSLSRDAVIARFPLPQPLRSPRVAENASWAN